VNLTVRRLGGGYGGKLFKPSLPAAAAAVAAKVTGRPVRLVMDLETNMRMIGKRLPYMTTYEVNYLK
jgi:xanthine dehydrogenase/oxidase